MTRSRIDCPKCGAQVRQLRASPRVSVKGVPAVPHVVGAYPCLCWLNLGEAATLSARIRARTQVAATALADDGPRRPEPLPAGR